jgi:hypothetical protein
VASVMQCRTEQVERRWTTSLPSKTIYSPAEEHVDLEARDLVGTYVALLPDNPAAFYPSSFFTTTTSSDFLLPPLYDVETVEQAKLVVDC